MADEHKVNADILLNSNNPDPLTFKEYLSSAKLASITKQSVPSSSKEKAAKISQYITLATAPESPVYTIKSRVIPHGKPDLELHLGPDLDCPVAAVGRIHVRNHSFGIPSETQREDVLTKGGIGEEFMTWENIKRVTTWTEKVYGFEWGVGRNRKSYTWLRTKPTGAMGRLDMKELELRVGNREQAEDGGECVAKWIRTKGPKTSKKGSLFIKRAGREAGEESVETWEHIVIITFLIVLEVFVRKGGGG
jgi:hypothetical protein